MVRIVFASDSHLNKHYARMTADQLGRRRAWLRSGWAATLDAAIAWPAHMYIHGGDLFDGPNPRAAELTRVAAGFQRLADAGIHALALGGNHDIPRAGGDEAPQEILTATRLGHVFTSGLGWWTATIEGLRIAVGCLAPDAALPSGADPLEGLTVEPPEADVVLLVAHHAVEGVVPPQIAEPVIRQSSIAALAGTVDLVLVGHVHAAADLSFGGVRVVFPGPTERMSFGEIGVSPGFVEIEAHSRDDIAVRQRTLRSQPMRLQVVRDRDVPQESPTEWLVALIRSWSAADQILQVRLEGALPAQTHREIRFHELARVGAQLNFYFDLDRHRLSIRSTEPAGAAPTGRLSPPVEIRRVAAQRIAAATSADERSLLAEAREMVLAEYGALSVTESG